MRDRFEQNDLVQPLLGGGPQLQQKSNLSYGADHQAPSTSDGDHHFPSGKRIHLLPPGSNVNANKQAASWVGPRHDTKKRQFPQTIAHRGYRAVHPENTMLSFKGAIEVGAHALETDIHLTKDDVVVLSHDPDLKRCFGREEKIIDCDWATIKELRTTQSPHVSMPRLQDLLEYISQPGLEHIWILLDIKLDNNAQKVMHLIADTIRSVEPGTRSWSNRIVLGVWAAKFLPLCKEILPGFAVSHIGFSIPYAREFLKVPNVSFNMLQKVLLGPSGTRFMRDVRKAGRPLFVWTVNDVNLMKWSIQKEVDGVITDDPRRFKEVCDGWRDDEPVARPSWAQWLYTFWLSFIITIFSIPFRRRFPEPIEKNLVRSKDMRARASLTFGA